MIRGGGGGGSGGGGRAATDPVQFGDPVTARIIHEIIPAGTDAVVFSDDFATDTLGDAARYPSGAAGFTVVTGQLNGPGGDVVLRSSGAAVELETILQRVEMGNGPGMALAGGDRLILTGNMRLFKVEGTTITALTAEIAPAPVGGHYARIFKVGNVVTFEGWTGHPRSGGVLDVQGTHALTGADATKFGTGITLYGCIHGAALNHKADNFEVYDTASAEQRQLVSEITRPDNTVSRTVLAEL